MDNRGYEAERIARPEEIEVACEQGKQAVMALEARIRNLEDQIANNSFDETGARMSGTLEWLRKH